MTREPILRVEDVSYDPDKPPIVAVGTGTCHTTVCNAAGRVYRSGVLTTKGLTRAQRPAYRAALDAASLIHDQQRIRVKREPVPREETT